MQNICIDCKHEYCPNCGHRSEDFSEKEVEWHDEGNCTEPEIDYPSREESV